MPGRKTRESARPNPTLAEIELECVRHLRRIGDKLNSLGSAMENVGMLAEMTGKKARKGAQRSASPTRMPAGTAGPRALDRVDRELEADCAQLRRIGDKLNFQQKLLNLISKLFNVVT